MRGDLAVADGRRGHTHGIGAGKEALAVHAHSVEFHVHRLPCEWLLLSIMEGVTPLLNPLDAVTFSASLSLLHCALRSLPGILESVHSGLSLAYSSRTWN